MRRIRRSSSVSAQSCRLQGYRFRQQVHLAVHTSCCRKCNLAVHTSCCRKCKTHSPEHKIAISFNPGNHTMGIGGRPVQLIMLSQEGGGWLERDMYVPLLFRPLPALVIDGYTADDKGSPRGPKHFCVIRWFQVIFFGKQIPSKLHRQ